MNPIFWRMGVNGLGLSIVGFMVNGGRAVNFWLRVVFMFCHIINVKIVDRLKLDWQNLDNSPTHLLKGWPQPNLSIQWAV